MWRKYVKGLLRKSLPLLYHPEGTCIVIKHQKANAMIKKISCSLAVLCTSLAPAIAEEWSVSGGVDFTSAYIFRGVQLADAAAQPYVEFSNGSFYAGVWSSTPLDNRDLYDNEVDVYVGYGFDISESLEGDVGLTRYVYTDGDGGGDTTEIYAGMTADAKLSPSVNLYRDFDLEATTLEGSLGHSAPMGEGLSFDLGTSVGYVDTDDDNSTYFLASAALTREISEGTSAYVSLNYGHNSEDTFIDDVEKLINDPDPTQLEDSGFWFGVGFSTE